MECTRLHCNCFIFAFFPALGTGLFERKTGLGGGEMGDKDDSEPASFSVPQSFKFLCNPRRTLKVRKVREEGLFAQ